MSTWAIDNSNPNCSSGELKLTFSRAISKSPSIPNRPNLRSDSLSTVERVGQFERFDCSQDNSRQVNSTSNQKAQKARSRSVSLKRKAPSTSKTATKRINLAMDQEAIKSLIEQTTEAVVSKMRIDMGSLEERIVDQMKNITSPIESAMNTLSSRNDDQDKRIDGLSAKIEELKSEITEEIRSDLREEIFEAKKEQTRLALLSQIEKSSTNIILYGYGGDVTIESIRTLFATMEVEDHLNLSIIKVNKLGLPKGGGNKKAPVLVTLGNVDQRNNVLKAGGKLPKGVTMERDMPPPYRAGYKKFKKHAWRLRAIYNIKTQIIFESHILILRYKEEGKSFTIVDEFIPTQATPPERLKKNVSSGSGPPSTVISGKGFTQQNSSCVIFMPNQEIRNAEHLYELITPFLSERAMREIRESKINKGNVVIATESPETATRVARALNGQSANGKKMFAEAFGDEI